MTAATEPRVQSVLYYSCGKCGATYRVERLNPAVTARAWHCPGCGMPAQVKQDNDEDVWYTITRACGLTPEQKTVRLIKAIYETWDTHEYRRFTEYVKDLRKGKVE